MNMSYKFISRQHRKFKTSNEYIFHGLKNNCIYNKKLKLIIICTSKHPH